MLDTTLAASGLRAAPAVQPADILFTRHSAPRSAEQAQADGSPVLAAKAGGLRVGNIDIAKLSIDVNNTQRQGNMVFVGNESMANVNLLERIMKSSAALWRNPVRTRAAHWGRREVMHVFNGWFHQTMTDYERYETFGRCYTSPDPFRNDDPPWKPVFC